uniref:Uncharacterized protein n=1 Tax=Meloidogyne enterolobii TaxID=390850 RepID=A0A6V7X2X1_MELEN|nr:unnamed protein product [Meloidogyne enterolobii]
MIIVRCWMQKLFNCSFKHASFDRSVFNPEMINILFTNDRAIPLQFNIQDAILSPISTHLCGDTLKFASNHLSISESLDINLKYAGNTDQYLNVLFNIIINVGNKIPKTRLRIFELTQLYDLIVEYIITSKDCSKMIPIIILNSTSSPNFKLNERAENVEINQSDYVKYTTFQLANIYNPTRFCQNFYIMY